MRRRGRRPDDAARRPGPAGTAWTTRRDDAGVTLVELVVSMATLSFVVAGSAAFAVGMQRTIARTEKMSRTQTDLRAVADVLARELPAVSAVSDPGTSGGSWFVEFRVDATATGTAVCYQWKLDPVADTLSERSWDPAVGTPTAWAVRARDVVNDAASDPPFVVDAPSDANTATRVDTSLAVQHAGGPLLRSLETFTLRNVPFGGTSSTACSQVVRS